MVDPDNRLLADDVLYEFQRHKELAERAITQLGDSQFFQSPRESANSVAVIVKHLAGNLSSRWTDFLREDGEKRHRDRENEW